MSKNTRLFSSSNEDALAEIAMEKRAARTRLLGMGFLVLVGVIGVVITAVVVQTISEHQKQTREAALLKKRAKLDATKRTRAEAYVEHISGAFDWYYIENQVCANRLSDLGLLPQQDPWGNTYRYEAPTSWRPYLEVRSSGPDGRPYTGDDVLNRKLFDYEQVEGFQGRICRSMDGR